MTDNTNAGAAAPPADTSAAPANPQVPASAPAPDYAKETLSALLAAVNEDRATREAKAQHTAEEATYKAKYEELASKYKAVDSAKEELVLNPAGYLRSLGLDDKTVAQIAEGIAFALVPEKAPPDHLAKQLAAQRQVDLRNQAKREEEAKAKAESDAKAQTAAREAQIEAEYKSGLKYQVQNLPANTYPASQTWFADDHDGYVAELFAEASRIAEVSLKEGRRVDPTLEAAKAVEARYSAKFDRIRGPAAPATKQTTFGTLVPAGTTPTTRAAKTSAPQSRFPSDDELIKNAVRAAFGTQA